MELNVRAFIQSNYMLRDVEPPTAEAAERVCEVFRKVGLKAPWRRWRE